MATDRSTPEQDAQSDPTAGFEFDTAAAAHEIDAAYSWQYVDRMYVAEEGDIRRSEDTDGYYGEDETFECSCGETFPSEREAKAHLRDTRVLGPPVSSAHPHGEFRWQEESEPGFDGCVEFVVSKTGTAGRVVDGAAYLIATARTTYTPPANYAFEDWAPLQSGRLSNHRNEPLFSERVLSKALGTLSSGHQYIPERYTLYFRGHTALYLEGPQGGIVIAERRPN